MDLPPFLYHHHRYAPNPLPPPPTHPPLHFSDDPNFYPRHHDPQFPPPPPPPPQQQPLPSPSASFLPLPRPPPLSPHHAQFTFRNINPNHPIDDFPRSNHRRPHTSPRNHRRPPEFDRPYPENRPDLWDPSRVFLDRRPARLVPDNEAHHGAIDLELKPVSPFRGIDKFRHDAQGNSRFREGFSDGFDQSRREEFVSGRNESRDDRRGHFVSSNSDRNYRNLDTVYNHSSFSREFESNSAGLIRNGRSYDMSENHRWDHSRQVLRDNRDSMIEMGNNMIVDGDSGAWVFARKHEYYGSESGRYSNRRSGENCHEPNRGTPTKQVQKKSAFLRIQMAKPNNKNREDERLHYSGYADESNSSSCRGKEHVAYSGYGTGEEREGSPVELDVSFKSNSLVAKAIVFPSRTTVESDNHSTPRDSKIKKVTMSDRDCSGSQLNKLDEGIVQLESSTYGEKNASGFGKDLKQLGEKVMATVTGNAGNISSQPGSKGTHVSNGKSKAERSLKDTILDKGGNRDGSGKTSLKVAKRKKVVKKIVKKVLIPRSQWLSSQSMKKPGELVKADSSTHIPNPAQSSDKGGTQLFPDQANVLPENTEVDGSPKAMVSEEGGADVDSGRPCVSEINRESNCQSSPLRLPSEETKFDKCPVNADNSVNDLCTISNSCKDLTISPNETIISYIGSVEDVSKQVYGNEESLSVESGMEKESPELLYSGGGNVNYGFLSVEIHDDHINTCNSTSMMNTYLDFDNGLSQEKITVSDICHGDAINKEPCTDQVTTSLEDNILEGQILGSNNVCTNVEVTVPNSGTSVDICEQPSPVRVTVSLENGAIEGSPHCMVSAKGNKEDTTPIIKKKRKVRSPRLDLSTLRITDTDVGPINVVSPRHAEDIILSLSVNDSSPAEVTASGIRSLGFSSQYTDGGNHLHGSSSADGLSGGVNVGPDETSSKHKKRKLFVPLPGSSSQMTFEINEGPVIADTPRSGTECPSTPNDFVTHSQHQPSTSNNGLTQQEEEVVLSSMDSMCGAALLSCEKRIPVLLEDSLTGGSFGPDGSVGDAFGDDGLKVEHSRFDSCSNVHESNIPNTQSLCPSGLEGEHEDNITPVSEHQVYIMNIESSRGERLDVLAAEKQVIIHCETEQCRTPLEHQSPEWDQRLPSTDMGSDSYLIAKDDVPPVSNYPSLSADSNGNCTTNSNDQLMEYLPDTLSNIGSPETFSDVQGIHMLSFELSFNQMSNEKGFEDNSKLDENPAVESVSDAIASSSFSQYTKVNSKLDNAKIGSHSVSGKTIPLPLHENKTRTQNLNLTSGETNGRKNQPNFAAPRIFPGRSSFILTTSKAAASSTHIAKPRTWHRTRNSSAPPFPGKKPLPDTVPVQREPPKKFGRVQSTSYIRKGNSLVRKPAPPQGSHGLSSSLYRLKSTATDEVKKSTGSDSRVEVIDPPSFLSPSVPIAPFERPRTPPLPNSTKFPNFTSNSSGDCTSSPLAEPLFNVCSETTSDPMVLAENDDVPKFSEDALKISETNDNHTGPVNNMDSQSETNGGNLVSSNKNSIIYVKRKSNQLVAAASNTRDLTVDNADKTQALSSDGYYKRKKNQLIRASLESHSKQTVALPDDSSNSEGGQKVHKVISGRVSNKRHSDKVVGKSGKRSKLSLVWTLHDTQSSRKCVDSLCRQKVLPHLFPWKRATYRRTCFPNLASIRKNGSLSMINKKLLLSRQRAAVYTRSIHGFSLRKSKVLSVGGSSLKWSKSIERHSKKANEEATLAVAAVEREKREQNGATRGISGTKSRNQSSHKSVNGVALRAGKRIFRIGSFRYKMDSSRRTLQRISDDESSCSAALQSDKIAKKSYIPRRLVIGNNEYVRIGSGNQLIRDPKKRTRLLASEKVRWSLHTARLRSARKQMFCQFFTRFGKCNKENGKCPYIHDLTKIAVCTKFLNGLCSNSNCKLTHKVIPERMPDCSYFLQGLCSNENCPYRHVNVNPNASTCEGFLRGYCADGNECRKKHSYVCPSFEATGVCPQGSKCKLHHPKNRSKEKKRKRSREQKNAQGRYFGSMPINMSNRGSMVSEKPSAQNHDDIFFDGGVADYICLDASDEETGENNNLASLDPTNLCDINASDTEIDDLDELIKPIRIMNKNDDIIISTGGGSSSEKPASYAVAEFSYVKEVKQLGILLSNLTE